MAIKKNSFAERYAELEKIVAWFENADFDLEEGIAKFTEGAALVNDLQEQLKKLENKVEELKSKL